MPNAEIVSRVAGRVLVLDEQGRLLMMHAFDPARPAEPFWITIGGGIEPGEAIREAAARELAEEAGITAAADELGDAVWSRHCTFSFDGARYAMYEEYFVLRVGAVQPSGDGMEQIEQQTLLGYRWWSADEIEPSGEVFVPPELPGLLRRLTA